MQNVGRLCTRREVLSSLSISLSLLHRINAQPHNNQNNNNCVTAVKLEIEPQQTRPLAFSKSCQATANSLLYFGEKFQTTTPMHTAAYAVQQHTREAPNSNNHNATKRSEQRAPSSPLQAGAEKSTTPGTIRKNPSRNAKKERVLLDGGSGKEVCC